MDLTPEQKAAAEKEAAEKAAADAASKSSETKDLLGAINTLVGTIKEQQAAGDSRAVERAAAASGLDEATIQKLISDAAAEGDVGKGVARAIKAVEAQGAQATLAALGMQKVDLLAVHPEHSAAFQKHGPGFRKFLAGSGLNIAGLATTNPASGKPYSEEIFQHYLLTQTKWYDEKASERETKARAEERAKVEAEIAARTGRPAPGALPIGAAPEGGSLRDSIRRAAAEAGELNDTQIDRAKRMGATDEDLKIVAKSRASKTVMGTPILAIPTSNEGAR